MGVVGTEEDDVSRYTNFGLTRLEARYMTPGGAYSTYMGIATTSLMLRILEHPGLKKLNKDLWSLELQNPTATMQQASWDLAMTKTYPLAGSNRRYSAIDMQWAYAELGQEVCKKLGLPDDEVEAAEEWLRVCDDLEQVQKGQKELATLDRIGWVAKYLYLERTVGDTAAKNGTIKALAHCLYWDRIVPSPTGHSLISRTDPPGIREKAIQYATEPAPDTRAAVRAAFIRDHEPTSMMWSAVRLGSRDELVIMHPYDTDSAYFHRTKVSQLA